MIHHDDQLKLQAYLDGELAAREAADVLALLAASAEARQLLAELQFTAAALTGHEADLKHPEPHDFFWSKIRREIQRQEQSAAATPKTSWADWLLRRFAPVGALAVLTVSLVIWLLAHSAQESLPPTPAESDPRRRRRRWNSPLPMTWMSAPIRSATRNSK